MPDQPKKLVLSLPEGFDLEIQFRELGVLPSDVNAVNDKGAIAGGSKWGVNDDGNIYSDCGCGGGNCAC